jgi:hypothetical protein
MMPQIEERNAKITSTMLGIEDHGIMTFMLHLDYGGSGQGAGGYVLDTPIKKNGKFSHRQGVAAGMDIILKILELLNVGKWEDLPGHYCRVRSSHSSVDAIGHPLKDRWLNFKEHFDSFVDEDRP